MFAGLGDKVAETAHQFEANLVCVVYGRLVHSFEETRIEVLAVLLHAQVEGHVVDAGTDESHVVGVFAEVAHQLIECALDAVAKADGGDTAGSGDCLHVHRHGIGVVQKNCARTDFLHVSNQTAQHGEGAQGSEKAAGAGGIGDGKVQTVLAWDFEVDQSGVKSADLNHVDDKVGAAQRFFLVQRSFDRGCGANGLRQLAAEVGSDLQPIGIDVHIGKRRVFKFREAKDIARQILGKNDASRANHCNFDHV